MQARRSLILKVAAVVLILLVGFAVVRWAAGVDRLPLAKNFGQTAIADQTILIGNGRVAFGDIGAPVSVVGFFDLSSQKLGEAHRALIRLIGETQNSMGQNKIYFVWRHFPNEGKGQAVAAAKALEAARILGKFDKMADLLISRRSEWVAGSGDQIFISYARELGLDEELFREKISVSADALAGDVSAGKQIKVPAGGAIFINGKPVARPTYEILKKEIDRLPWPNPSPTPEAGEATEEGR